MISGAYLASESWQQVLAHTLPVFGHRNWVVAADSAFPQSSHPGVRTIVADTDQQHAVRSILTGIEEIGHVRPAIYVDSELEYLSEEHAPGIEAYRNWLAEAMSPRLVQRLPHEQILAKLNEIADSFQVLVVKSHMRLPYTSVFFELECGYWSGEAESELRSRIAASSERVEA